VLQLFISADFVTAMVKGASDGFNIKVADAALPSSPKTCSP
jgi:hypothetical protein